jgi:hypothetical protein
VFAASSLEDAAREQYAAMQAGGGAVAAPPKKGSSKTGQPQAATEENRESHGTMLCLGVSSSRASWPRSSAPGKRDKFSQEIE